MKDIIIFGQMGSGKTTIAHTIMNKNTHIRLGLGDKIHLECMLHGNHTRKEKQDYGQAMRKVFGIDVWCDYLWKRYHWLRVMWEEDGEKCKYLVIDDGRQLNELKFFKERSFYTIGVKTEIDLRQARLFERNGYITPYEDFSHDTEIQAKECVGRCDVIIENNGTIQELIDKVNKILHEQFTKCKEGVSIGDE